ncbi:MAG: methylated-DNA--[protein]-cysteine S-methyltransferase [Candidatus Hydrogenedens sp.]|nr:methylated-DNA--[protein]-cysteine S-methyltransferase [Candidatus Hydrogenedens sp.]
MHEQDVNFCFRFEGGAFYGFFSDLGLKRLTLVPEGERIPARLSKAPAAGWDKTLHGLLSEYFCARTVSFDAIPLDMTGGTPFQQKVWKGCYRIPYGKTATYGELARRIKHPGAARATGTALGVNPICLVVPCHRIVSSTGTLGGYYYGLSWKTRFLNLEEAGLKKKPVEQQTEI